MIFDEAIRWSEILLGLAFAQLSLEHMVAKSAERIIFSVRLVLAVLLILGIQTPWVLSLLFITVLVTLFRFQGPYNGGADRMGILILCCLCLVYFLPNPAWKEMAFAYLAVQLTLSYFISGWVKIINKDWRNGRALADVFMFSAYPVSESLRDLARSPGLLLRASWVVMLFELLFPLSLLSYGSLVLALCLAGMFHLANACVFGLNRFFWIWLAAYPSILWFQQRFIPG